jgi:competence protein ComEC
MSHDNRVLAGWGTPALAGTVLGAALQVQQAALWGWGSYAAMAGLGSLAALAVACSLSLRERAGARAACALVAASLLSFSVCGLRAVEFAAHALDPSLEGRDVSVTGVVGAMPQRNETGLRFRLQVESAAVDGAAVQLVPQLYLGWYANAAAGGAATLDAQRQAPDLRAGERWRMNVRLKAPHGNSNPHGFDYELSLWEQGVQATGYVRDGRNDPPPRRVADTWQHPVERARQSVRDAVFAYVADRKTAGLLAALIVGDQAAIGL